MHIQWGEVGGVSLGYTDAFIIMELMNGFHIELINNSADL